jgi:RNA polymerase sigma-70 factor (ECF subfamily)
MPQLKKGRMEAFEMLLARYRKPIFSFIFRMLGDFHRAQDVFQETFLRVFRHAQRFDESLRFSPWFYRIARNLCLEEIRRRERIETVSINEETELQPRELWEGRTPDEELERREMRQVLEKAILRLTERQREVFLLREIQGLSYEEIAGITGMSVPAVKSCLHRARMALKEMLAPYLKSGEMPTGRRVKR